MHVNFDFNEGQMDNAIRKQKCNAQNTLKTSRSIGEEHIKGETSLNKCIC